MQAITGLVSGATSVKSGLTFGQLEKITLICTPVSRAILCKENTILIPIANA